MIPSVDALERKSAVYAHYMGKERSEELFSMPISQEEMNQAMAEAERSYLVWKKMQQQLQQIIQEWRK